MSKRGKDTLTILQEANAVVPIVSNISHETRKNIIISLQSKIDKNRSKIFNANLKDQSNLSQKDPKYDRLVLNDKRIDLILHSLNGLLNYDDPIGRVLYAYNHPSGMSVVQKTSPLGVIGMIFESRPNVMVDAFSLSILSSNVSVLKGSSDASNTNETLIDIFHEALQENFVPSLACQLLSHDRSVVLELCKARGLIDCLIPRGGKSLIDFVVENSSVPVIETGASIVHVYFDEFGDEKLGNKVILNSKTRRVSVCNALDCLVIHKKRLMDLKHLLSGFDEKNVEIFADQLSYDELSSFYPKNLLRLAEEKDYETEFLDYKMSIKTVDNMHDAISHIRKYSKGHTECIITKNERHKKMFIEQVDAAVIFWNASTAFTDGFEFGLGAEIGISTQKLHARGPFSFQHLVTTKWICEGSGQTRE